MVEDNTPKESWLWSKVKAFIPSFFKSKTQDAPTRTDASGSTPISRTKSSLSGDSEAASQASTKRSETDLVASEASSDQASRPTKFGTFSRRNLTFKEKKDADSKVLKMKAEIDAQLAEKSQKEADNNAKVREWLNQLHTVDVTKELSGQAERKAQELTRQAEMDAESKREGAEAAACAILISPEKAPTGTEPGLAKRVVQFDKETKTRDGGNETPDTRTLWKMEGDGLMKELYAKANERAKKIETNRQGTQKAKEEFLSNYYLNGFEDPNLQEKRIEDYAKAKDLDQKQIEALRERMGKENGLTHHEIVTSRQGSSKDAKPNSPEVGNPPHPGGHKGLQGLNNKNTRENVGENEEGRSTKLHNPHQHGLCQTPSRLGRPLIPPRTR